MIGKYTLPRKLKKKKKMICWPKTKGTYDRKIYPPLGNKAGLCKSPIKHPLS